MDVRAPDSLLHLGTLRGPASRDGEFCGRAFIVDSIRLYMNAKARLIDRRSVHIHIS